MFVKYFPRQNTSCSIDLTIMKFGLIPSHFLAKRKKKDKPLHEKKLVLS